MKMQVKFSGNIDRENRIIKNVIMCQVGEAKGHNVHLDEDFIAKVAELGAAEEKGIKSHYNHNWDTTGKIVGRIKNIHASGTQAIGDLHFYKSADLSPSIPNSVEYILGMSEEDPESLMLSIVFTHDGHYQKIGDQKVPVWYYNADDEWVPANPDYPIFISIKELNACDVVGEGAATDRMFNSNALENRLNDLISTPGFEDMFAAKHKNFPIIEKFYSESITGWLKKQFTKTAPAIDTQMQELASIKAERDQFQAKINELEEEIAEFASKKEAFQAEIDDLKAAQAALQAKLDETPEDHTSGGGNADEGDLIPNYMFNPINQKFSKQL